MRGKGDMGDLVWVRIFSSKPLEIEFFPWHTTVQDFFSSMIPHERFFFQCRNFFPLGISLQGFFLLEISLLDTFFQNHLYPPPPPASLSKVKWSAPKMTSFKQHFSAKFLGLKWFSIAELKANHVLVYWGYSPTYKYY